MKKKCQLGRASSFLISTDLYHQRKLPGCTFFQNQTGIFLKQDLYLLAGAGGRWRFWQFSRTPSPSWDSRSRGAAVCQEWGREADVVFGCAVHLLRAGHAWEGIELRGKYFGVAAYSQRPLWGRLWGSYCTAVLLLLSHPLTHKVLLKEDLSD